MEALSVFLFSDFLGQTVAVWLAFLVIIVALLAFDLGFANKGDHEIGIRRSLAFSALYIAIALIFGGYVWWSMGPKSGMDYLTGFVVEKSLALDNIFVTSLIFTAFAVPRAYQHRVLFWGIVGVVVLRAIMIGLGAALFARRRGYPALSVFDLAAAVVPIGRWRAPSACRKWNPSTRTGPCASTGAAATSGRPVTPSSERAVDRVSKRHSPSASARARITYTPSPS